MFQKRILLPLVIILFISFGLITHLIASYPKATRRLNQSSNSILSYEPPIIPDLTNPDVREEIQRKILEEKAYTHDFIRLPLDYFEKEFEEEERKAKEKYGENNLRKLEQYNYFDDVLIVDPLLTTFSQLYKLFVRNMKQFSSNIILYPYQFDCSHIVNETEINKHYEQGGFISLDPKGLEADNIGLKTHNTLAINKARALFDADIAILSIKGYYLNENYTDADYFTDGSYWGDFLRVYFGKGNLKINYEEFLTNKKSNPQKTYSTLINETEIQNGNLMNEQLPRFGILIIPDFYLSAEISLFLEN